MMCLRHSSVGHFITLNQDLLTSNSSILSNSLNILEKSIEAVTGMRHHLTRNPVSSFPEPGCFSSRSARASLSDGKGGIFIHTSYSGWLDVNRSAFQLLGKCSTETLLKIIRQDAMASVCNFMKLRHLQIISRNCSQVVQQDYQDLFFSL